MTDKEKVLTGLEMHEKKKAGVGCLECPYAEVEGGTDDWCIRGLHRDIFALLREQEAVEPREQEETRTWIVCGNCSQHLISKWLWCPYCGKKVKWE